MVRYGYVSLPSLCFRPGFHFRPVCYFRPIFYLKFYDKYELTQSYKQYKYHQAYEVLVNHHCLCMHQVAVFQLEIATYQL